MNFALICSKKNLPHLLDPYTFFPFSHYPFIHLYSYYRRTQTDIGFMQGCTMRHANKFIEDIYFKKKTKH